MVLFSATFLALSCAAHVALFRWARRSFPRPTERFRQPLFGVVAILFVLPLLRFPGWRTTPLPTLAALGTFWHLAVAMTAVPIVVGRLLGRVARRVRRSTTPVGPPLEPRATTDAEPAPISRRAALERVGGSAVFLASSSTLAWGAVRGRLDFRIEEVPIRMARLPKVLDGFTIAQVSDIHVGTFIGEQELARGLSLVARTKPDLVVVTGDMVDFDPRYVPLAARMLGGLAARHGVVCIPGNHDHYTGIHEVLGGMRRAGIDVLMNRGKVVAAADGGGLALLGVDDLSGARRGARFGPDLARAKAMVPPDLATILLAHQPPYVEQATHRGIDLQLSGHTHGGQISLGGLPAHLFMRYVAGRYDVEGTTLYVNRGFGTVGPPSRVGAPPEITKLVLVAG